MKATLKTATPRIPDSFLATELAAVRKCRICGSGNIRTAGFVEYYSGFAWPIDDCGDCQARFTKHDETIYDAMHSEAGSVYNVYRDLLDESTKAFKDHDINALKQILSRASKYKFIIDEVERGPRSARLLEIGCSRGYLTSYFILSGYEVTGVDISESAVKSAREAFGDHFVLEGDRSIEDAAPYDVIYHVGTIGCVADPLGLTRRLLRLLKPGGSLLFNSPNLESCWLAGQLWIDAAPPPDLVSIFPPGFWMEHFRREAQVEEQIENCHDDKALAICVSRLFGRRWKKPLPIPLDRSSDRYVTRNGGNRMNGQRRIFRDDAWQVFEKSVMKLFHKTGLSRLAPARPAEFGIFVKMTRKDSDFVTL
jgi:SAM-dependent methyltransferase